MLSFLFTVSSHLIVTFALALFLFLVIIVRGVIIHKLRFLGLFLPSGAPLLIVPLLVIVKLYRNVTNLEVIFTFSSGCCGSVVMIMIWMFVYGGSVIFIFKSLGLLK